MLTTILVFWALAFLSHPAASRPNDLFYTGFRGAAAGAPHVKLDGAAAILSDGILRLTSASFRVLGHAFYSSPIRFKASPNGPALSFSTCFAFAVVPQYPKLGGHGLAFVISRTSVIPAALPNQYLGLLNSNQTKNSNSYILAVEFDTVKDFEFSDIDDNHVGIDMNSMVSNVSAPAAYYAPEDPATAPPRGLNLTSGSTVLAWVDYDSARMRLDVTLSLSSVKPNRSILSFDVDLSPILYEFMYVGFSASTGLLASSHYVFGWSFNVTGQARPLDLSALPSLPGPEKSRRTLIAAVSVAAVSVALISAGIAFYLIRRIINADVIEAWELEIGPRRFSYQLLKRATRGFMDKELLGFGGFGRVYKGTLPKSKTEVAVKRISHESRQGLREFLSEIGSIGRLRHRNLVQLLGWCRRRGDLLLVYEYMPNGSLDKYLFDDPQSVLSWEQRFKIIKGVALGLLYLHEEWEQTVIHRDIKAGNVLLDLELNGRLGDFGLAKLYEHGANPCTTRVVGTLGYLAPELTRSGRPTTSSDVFAFGALLLEVTCGRRPIEPKSLPEQLVLVDWVWERWKLGTILDVVDPKLKGDFSEEGVVVALKVGLMCSADRPAERPTIRQVVRYLEGEIGLPAELPAPDSFSAGKKGDGGGDSEGFVHYHPNWSSFGKLTWSCGDDLDPTSSLSGAGDCSG